MTERGPYSVKVVKGWSYVVGPTEPKYSGPWRYRWEAQDEADRLNGVDGENVPGTRLDKQEG